MNRRSFMGLMAAAPVALKAKPAPMKTFPASAIRTLQDLPGIHVRYINNYEDPSKSRIDMLYGFGKLYSDYSCKVVG